MKIPRLVLVSALALVAGALCFAVTYTKQNTRVARFQIDTTFNGGTGTAIAVKADAFIETVLVNDADANDILERGVWKQVSFDLVDPSLSATTITAAGKTVTYPQLAALIRQACLDRANAAGIQ